MYVRVRYIEYTKSDLLIQEKPKEVTEEKTQREYLSAFLLFLVLICRDD